MNMHNAENPTTRLQPAKMITCILPDDGSDLEIMQQLEKEKSVTRVFSIACRGVDNLQTAKTRLGKLPDPILGRFLTIIVTEVDADEVFDLVHEKARIGGKLRGVLLQSDILGATAYDLPDDVPHEELD